MRLKEEVNRVKGLMEVLVEWSGDAECDPLFALEPKPTWYTEKEFDDGKVWIKDEDNHKDETCQKTRYKEFLKYVKDNGKDEKDYKIPELESSSNDDNDNDNIDDDNGGCMSFEEWNRKGGGSKAPDPPWKNQVAQREGRYIPLGVCQGEASKYFTSKSDGETETGKPASAFEVVFCYWCDRDQVGTEQEYKKKNYYRLKEETELAEDCTDYVIFSTDEGPTDSPDDDIEICITTDARLIKHHLGIEPYDLLASNNQDKIYSLTEKYGNDIYNECVVESPYWSGRDTEFRLKTTCLAKYKHLLQQVMPDLDPSDDEDVISGLSTLLEPFNAVVTMCSDRKCNQVLSVYSGEPQYYITNEIESWSEGSPERMESMNKRFYSKKRAVDSWLKSFLSKELDSQVDFKNFPFIDQPDNWPDQNVIDIIENSIALLLTNPASLKIINNTGIAYIKISNANPRLDGRYKIYFDQGSLLPRKLIPVIVNSKDMCKRLMGSITQNNYEIVTQNEYNEKKSTLNPRQLKFIQQMSYYLKGYKCITDTIFILPIE